MIVQHKDAAEPQYNDDHHGAEELAHGVGHGLADVDAHDVVAIVRVHLVEAAVHLLLGTEGLDDAQAAQRLLHLAHGVAPEGLGLHALALELAPHQAHEPSEDGHEDDGEERELPGDKEQRAEVDRDEDRVLEQHVERRHDARLHLLHVAAHAGNDVALALLAEKAQRQGGNLLVELVADVAHHTRTDGDDGGRGKEVGTGLQRRGQGQKQSNEEQRGGLAVVGNESVHKVVQVVHHDALDVAPVPSHPLGRCLGIARLEQYLQDGYERSKREDVQQRR